MDDVRIEDFGRPAVSARALPAVGSAPSAGSFKVLENAMQPPYDDPGCTTDCCTDHKMTVATNRLAALVAAIALSEA